MSYQYALQTFKPNFALSQVTILKRQVLETALYTIHQPYKFARATSTHEMVGRQEDPHSGDVKCLNFLQQVVLIYRSLGFCFYIQQVVLIYRSLGFCFYIQQQGLIR